MTNHSAKVYRLAYRLTGNKYDAEDLTQEVFVRVFRSLENFKPGTLDGWLHRITTNLFLDQARRKSRIRFDALADDAESRLPGREPGPEQSFEFNNLDVDVQAAWRSFPRTSAPPSCSATSRGCPTTRSPSPWASNSELSAPGSTAAGPCSGRSWRTATRGRSAAKPAEAAAEDATHRRPPLNRAMRLLERLLRGSRDRRRRHLESCAECRLQLRRERQYLERLRGAEVPSPATT